ncbi:hypothetical protein Hanom_Chr17g01541091 [Helianthus anomalus]
MMGPVEVVFFWIFSALGFVQSQNNFQILGEVSSIVNVSYASNVSSVYT